MPQHETRDQRHIEVFREDKLPIRTKKRVSVHRVLTGVYLDETLLKWEKVYLGLEATPILETIPVEFALEMLRVRDGSWCKFNRSRSL